MRPKFISMARPPKIAIALMPSAGVRPCQISSVIIGRKGADIENLRKKVALPWVSFCSDAASLAPQGVFLESSTHPRAYGSFARVLGMFARDEVNNLFGDGGNMIPHPLDVLGNEMQMHAGGNVARVFHHKGQEFPEERVVHLIDILVAQNNAHGHFRVPLDIGVQRFLEHQLNFAGHAPQRACAVIHRRHLGQNTRPLGHVFPIIPDALQIGADFDDRQNQTQVAGGGRSERDDACRFLIDQLFEGIDGFIIAAHFFRELFIAGVQRS